MLNLGKSVLAPLGGLSRQQMREQLREKAPLWGAMEIADTAKYLGFYVGPGRGRKSWGGALRKMEDRAAVWGKMGAG
eukprot:3518311-Pyramimonas_sp.AAC.1